jgi:ketosteroid isomerase-like protein
MKQIFLNAIILIAATSFVFGQNNSNRMSKDEKAVRRVLDEIAAALGSNDADVIDPIYTDDSTHVHTSGIVITKAQLIAGMRSGYIKFESLSRDDVSVHIYGNAAVAVSRITFKSKIAGQEASGQYRSTAMLVKIKGHWQIVAGQATTIAQK